MSCFLSLFFVCCVVAKRRKESEAEWLSLAERCAEVCVSFSRVWSVFGGGGMEKMECARSNIEYE